MSLNRRNAKVVFSRLASQALGLTTQQSLIFAKDEDTKNDWYLSILSSSETAAGLAIRNHKGSGYHEGNTPHCITCRALVTELLDSLKAKKGASLLLAQTPKEIDGKKWYQIMTAKPLRIN